MCNCVEEEWGGMDIGLRVWSQTASIPILAPALKNWMLLKKISVRPPRDTVVRNKQVQAGEATPCVLLSVTGYSFSSFAAGSSRLWPISLGNAGLRAWAVPYLRPGEFLSFHFSCIIYMLNNLKFAFQVWPLFWMGYTQLASWQLHEDIYSTCPDDGDGSKVMSAWGFVTLWSTFIKDWSFPQTNTFSNMVKTERLFLFPSLLPTPRWSFLSPPMALPSV